MANRQSALARLIGVEVPRPLADALHQCRRHFVAAAVFSLLINILYLAPTLYMLQVYDRVVPTGGQDDPVVRYAGARARRCSRCPVSTWSGSRLLVRASERVDALLAPRILEQMMGSDTAGTAQAMRDFDTIRQTIGTPVVAAMFDAPWTPVFLLVAFMLHFWIGVMAVVSAILLVTLAWRNQRATQARMEVASTAMAAAHNAQQAAAMQGAAVRGLGMTGAMVARQLDSRRIALAQHGRCAAGRQPTDGDQQVLPHVRPVGGARARRAAGDRRRYFGRRDHRGFDPAQPGAAADREHHRAAGPRSPRRARPSIGCPTCSRIWAASAFTPRSRRRRDRSRSKASAFAGSDGRPILMGISFRAQPGKILGIIGPNGSGKSTLGKVLVGAIQPTIGAVRLDGARLPDWDRAMLGHHIGYMPQEPSLFEGTIKENISRFARPATAEEVERIDEAVIAAATEAGVHELILQLPEAYETRLGLMGAGLSLGQAQRIALARALYGQPTVLVLDEPNAFLDQAGEAALIGALDARPHARRDGHCHRAPPLGRRCRRRIAGARRGPAEDDGPVGGGRRGVSPAPQKPKAENAA